jgi:hypothetical protein
MGRDVQYQIAMNYGKAIVIINKERSTEKYIWRKWRQAYVQQNLLNAEFTFVEYLKPARYRGH